MSNKIHVYIDMDPHSVMDQIKKALSDQGIEIEFTSEPNRTYVLEKDYYLKVLSYPKT